MTDTPCPYDSKDVPDELSFILHTTAHNSYLLANLLFAEAGVTVQQAVVLAFIYHHKGCNQKAIEDHVKTKSASVTVLINTMTGKGLIEKQRNPVDGRGVVLSLTPKGRRVFDKCREGFHRLNTSLMAGMSEGEIEQLKQGLRKVKENCLAASQAIEEANPKTSARKSARTSARTTA